MPNPNAVPAPTPPDGNFHEMLINASRPVSGREVDELRKRVDKADRALEQYKAEAGLFDPAGENLSDRQIAALNDQLVDARAKAAGAKAKYEQLKQITPDKVRTAAATADVLQSQVIMNLRGQYADAARKLAAGVELHAGVEIECLARGGAEVTQGEGDGRELEGGRGFHEFIARVDAQIRPREIHVAGPAVEGHRQPPALAAEPAQAGEEVHVPGPAAHLAIGDAEEPGRFLEPHRLADGLVLRGGQGGRARLPLVRLEAQRLEGGRPQQAADVIGAEGRARRPHHG